MNRYIFDMAIYGYARANTDGQALDEQVDALKAAGAAQVFCETASGANTSRAGLSQTLKSQALKSQALKSLGAGDTLLVTRLDRLARSTRDLLNIIDAIAKAGAGFRSIAETWADTTAPHGRLMLTAFCGLAEFERGLVRARTGAGRTRAKARGQHMGRPAALTRHQQQEAISALEAGTATQADLARRLNVSQSTISRLAGKQTQPETKPVLDSGTERAARSFMRHLGGRYRVRGAILFGSRARGSHTPDSDADIAVILDGDHGDRAAASMDMAGIAFHVMMETGVMVQALPLWPDELARPETFSNPALINNILREGVHL